LDSPFGGREQHPGINEISLTKKTILIVDDSPFIVERIMKLLNKLNSEYLIFSAQYLSDAQDILARTRFDIVLLDIHLQDRNGLELLRMVKGTYPDILVIMLTNQVSEQVILQCKKLGASFFLDKSKDFIKIPELFSSLN
jgi:CheY-like chemotaxis protein